MRGSWVKTILAGACLFVTLAGCENPLQGQVQRLPPLHISGLQQMVGLSNLNGSVVNGFRLNFFNETPFQQGDGKWQVLLYNGEYTPLYVAAQDGSGMRPILLTQGCSSPAAVSANGQWAACLTSAPNTDAGYIELASLSASAPKSHWQIPLAFSPSRSEPALSPDGAYLALIRQSSTGCAVVIYALAADHSQATLITTLTSTRFASNGECPVVGLEWSSDGARLFIGATLANNGLGSLAVDETLPIAKLLRTRVSALTIPASAFVPMFVAYFPRGLAMDSYDGRIALPGDDGVEVVSSGARGASSITFLVGNNLDYRAWGAAWTPDGKSLLLTIGPAMCVDRCVFANYVRDVYLYTPSVAA